MVADIERYYSGDGREVKRERSIWVDDPINYPQSPWGYWEELDDEYFIRSSVLGGAVVSEVGPTGKKKQTFVYAAGAKIAQQTEHVYNGNTYENVFFEQTDASGMSGRTTSFYGVPSEYYEADPMGGNMGVETPYVEPEPPPEPTEEFPAFEINDSDPFYVNGQSVAVFLDGMRLIGPVAAMILNGQNPNSPIGVLGVFGDFLPLQRIGNSILFPTSERIRETRRYAGWDGADLYDYEYQSLGAGSWGVSARSHELTTRPGLVDGKIIPRGLSESSCNFLLNQLFGNFISVAASFHEPNELLERNPNGGTRTHYVAGADRSRTEFATNIHIYGDSTGTRTGAPLYVPSNLNGSAPRYLSRFTSGRGKVFTSGEYQEPDTGIYSNRFLFGYNNGLTILVAHVAGGSGGKSGAESLSSSFLSRGRLVGPRNMAGSFQTGFIGGPGGNSEGYYIHSHIAFWRNGRSVNPRTEFCGLGGSRF